jgi:hypothetical protein
MEKFQCSDGLNLVVGVIYNPNHYSSCCCRWAHRTVRWCTGHCTVHCLVSAMSADRWSLELLTVEVFCVLAAPDSPVAHRTVLCDLTLQMTFWHLTVRLFRSRPLAKLTVALLSHRTVRWFIVDERWEKPESDQFVRCSARAPDSVRCAPGCTITPLVLLLLKLEHNITSINISYVWYT